MESGSTAAKLVSRKLKGETVDFQKEYVDHMMQGINTFRTYVTGWYNGDLHEIFFNKNQDDSVKRQICSVLAGYVWDLSNPWVKKHDRAVRSLAHIIRMQKAAALEEEVKKGLPAFRAAWAALSEIEKAAVGIKTRNQLDADAKLITVEAV